MVRFWLGCFMACALIGYARQGVVERGLTPQEEKEELPWFTGPIVAPSGHITPYGKVNLEPYVFYTYSTGAYNEDWKFVHTNTFTTVNAILPVWVGITQSIDFQFVPQFFYQEFEGKNSVRFGDLPLEFDFQLYLDSVKTPWPGVKFFVREILPTGPYQRLDPRKKGTDATGSGSFASRVGFVFQKLYHVTGRQYFRPRLFVAATYSAPVHVRGFNTYGGGYGTAGKVYPGFSYIIDLGLEYSLTRNWVLAMDVVDTISDRTRFKGQKGFTTPECTSTGLATSRKEASIGGGSTNNLSLAPAIEYNFNEAMGLIGGAWFSVAGKNSGEFVSWVIAFNYYN